MKNILITGGAGFIGSKLCLKLISRGYSVTVLDSLLPQIHGENPETQSPLYQSISGKVRFLKADISDRKSVENAVENQDAIIHLAAETGTGQSMYEIERYTKTNVLGTAVLLDVLTNAKHHVQKLILASSRAVYGEGKYQNAQSEILFPKTRTNAEMSRGNFEMTDAQGNVLQPLPTDEDAELNPTSLYGLTKLQQEQLVKQICGSLGLDFTILRYQNVYGAGQSLKNPYTGIISIFSAQMMSDKEINIFEDGLSTRDFVHVEDVAEATIRALEKKSFINQTLNIGTGKAISVLNVAQLLAKKYRKNARLTISGDFRLGDIRHHFAEISKLKKNLNFEPKISLEEGLAEFTDWVLQQTLPENNYQNSLEEMKEKGFLKS